MSFEEICKKSVKYAAQLIIFDDRGQGQAAFKVGREKRRGLMS